MQLTQQIRIQPTPEQKQVLWDLSEKCRLIYNFALNERKETFKTENRSVSYIDQQNQLPTIKNEYPEYKWVYSKVLQYTLRTLDADFKSFFKLWKNGWKEARPPKYKGKRYFTTMTYNQSGFNHQQGMIQLSHKHFSNTPLQFTIPKQYQFDKIYQISIYRKDKQFYLSITYEQPTPEYHDNGLYQAFDLGVMKHTAINTHGKTQEFTIQRPDKYWNKHIKELQQRRDHCKKGSRRYKYLDACLRRCKRKSSDQTKDHLHKLSRKIIDNTRANTLIVGDLSVKQMVKKNKHQKALHTSLHNTGIIGRFIGLLTYKAKLCGKRVGVISEQDTSKTCCACGNKKDRMPLYQRTYHCEICGNTVDRDVNSSVNIMLRFLSTNALWTRHQQFVDNLRQTGMEYAERPTSIYSKEAPSSTVQPIAL